MVSLANPSLLQKWISFAVERSNPFRGMGLVPLEAQTFMSAIAKTFLKDKKAQPLEWQILVSHHKVGGFRQVVLKNGKLVFTRMAQPIGESNPEVIAGNIEQEMINTQEYLKRMGLQDPSTLSVIILASAEIKQVLDPKNIKSGEYHFLTPYDMSEALSLTDAAQPEDHFGDIVISAFIGRNRKLLLPLQTPYTSKLHKLSLYIKSSQIIAALAALSILGWSGMTEWDIISTYADSQDIVDQQKNIRSQLDIIKAEEKNLPKQIDKYTDIMNISKVINKRHFDPLVFVNTLSDALKEKALVKRYSWGMSDPLGLAKNPDKRPVESVIEIKLAIPQQPHDQFITSTQQLMDSIKQSFVDFDVIHSELPGMLSETKDLKTVMDSNGNVSVTEGESAKNDTVTLTFKSPKEAVKNGH
jgi:hypothetical protein